MARAFLLAVAASAAIVAATAPAFASPADELAAPAGVEPGDAGRGRAIVADRQKGLCLLCHTGPLPEQKFQGDLAPDLAGVGSRLNLAQLRMRLADSSKINPDTIMPAYARVSDLNRVGNNWRGKPILSAQDIEDVATYLTTLKDPEAKGEAK